MMRCQDKTINEVASETKRGSYLIVPLKYDDSDGLPCSEPVGAFQHTAFTSDDFTSFLQNLTQSGTFVQQYVQACEKKLFIKASTADNDILVKEVRFLFFQHGIAFLLIYLGYSNASAGAVYKLLQSGYLTAENGDLIPYIEDFIAQANKLWQRDIWLYEDGDNAASDATNRTLNESYCFHIGYLPTRFAALDTLEQLTFRLHKVIDCAQAFEDNSQTDLAYAYGAKDVELGTYRWGCCITSQSISYMYGTGVGEALAEAAGAPATPCEQVDIQAMAANDLALAMLAMYQKYICMDFNDRLYKALAAGEKRRGLYSTVDQLNRDALDVRASSRLAPSQISRWNNVCDTYRALMKVNGIEEAFADIEKKLELIQIDKERKSARIQGYIAGMITLLGLVSIVDSVLSILAAL